MEVLRKAAKFHSLKAPKTDALSHHCGEMPHG
jgi:hypothetical protein